MKQFTILFSLFLASQATASFHILDGNPVIAPRWTDHSSLHARGPPGKSPGSSDGESAFSGAVDIPSTNIAFGIGTTDSTRASILKVQRWQQSLHSTGPQREANYMADTTSSYLRNKQTPPSGLVSPSKSLMTTPDTSFRRNRAGPPSGAKPNYMKETASSLSRKGLKPASDTSSSYGPKTPSQSSAFRAGQGGTGISATKGASKGKTGNDSVGRKGGKR